MIFGIVGLILEIAAFVLLGFSILPSLQTWPYQANFIPFIALLVPSVIIGSVGFIIGFKGRRNQKGAVFSYILSFLSAWPTFLLFGICLLVIWDTLDN